MDLLLRSFPWFRSLGPLFFLLTSQSFLSVLEISPLILFLADVSLDAEHEEDLLSEFVVEFHSLFSSDYLGRNVHALKYLCQSFIDFAWQIQRLRKVLLSCID